MIIMGSNQLTTLEYLNVSILMYLYTQSQEQSFLRWSRSNRSLPPSAGKGDKLPIIHEAGVWLKHHFKQHGLQFGLSTSASRINWRTSAVTMMQPSRKWMFVF